MWTRTATNGILPRHTCSARCRGTASIRDLAVAVGAVPVSINQQVVSNTVCPRHAEIAHDARWPVDMWTTQGRCPHTHRPNNNRNQLQFDKFGAVPTGPEGSKPTWRQGRPTNPLHQLYAGTENHSHLGPYCTGALTSSGNEARLRAPQLVHRQSWTRCSVTTRGVGSGRSNTWRALWPALMAGVTAAPQAVQTGG